MDTSEVNCELKTKIILLFINVLRAYQNITIRARENASPKTYNSLNHGILLSSGYIAVQKTVAIGRILAKFPTNNNNR